MAPKALLPPLAAAALLLAGCGGGGEKKPNTSPAELRSQTVAGTWSGSATIRDAPMPYTASTTLYFDADSLSMRMDLDANVGPSSQTTPLKATLIANAGAKRATAYATRDPKVPNLLRGCVYSEDVSLPEVDLLKSLAKSLLMDHKPEGMDGDYRKWSGDMSRAGVAGHASVDLDDGQGLRKFSADVKVDQGQVSARVTSTFSANSVSMGKPEASLFDVPKSWEPCQSVTPPTEQPLALLLALLQGNATDALPLGSNATALHGNATATAANASAESLLVV